MLVDVRRFKYVALFFLCGVQGCLRRPSDEAILKPLAIAYSDPLKSRQPSDSQYVLFTDSLTAKVFRSSGNQAGYRVAPSGSKMSCIGSAPGVLPGFYLRLRVVSIAGDSAVGVVEQSCLSGSKPVTWASSYLLRRQDRRWQVAKALGGVITR